MESASFFINISVKIIVLFSFWSKTGGSSLFFYHDSFFHKYIYKYILKYMYEIFVERIKYSFLSQSLVRIQLRD